MKSIIEVLEHRLNENSTSIALTYKDNQKWHYYRWQDVYRIAKFVGAGLAQLGITAEDKVGIVSKTRVEWMLSDLGCMICRCVSVPIYPNLSPEETAYIINHSECRVLILEDEDQYNNWKLIKEECPQVETVIMIKTGNIELSEGLYSWAKLLQTGNEYLSENPSWYQDNYSQLDIDDVFTIPYTSGTTGQPKGVVLTYRQILSELQDVFSIMAVDERDTSLCFLPQSHIMGRVETLGSVYAGYRLAFAESIDLFKTNILEIKPTFIIAVPRVFEKIHTGIQLKLNQSSFVSKPIKKAIGAFGKLIKKIEQKAPIPASFALSNFAMKKLIGGKVKEAFGGRLRFAISGGAPLNRDIAEFFFAIGLPVYEGYGLTETTASVFFNSPLRNKLGTVGPALEDVQVQIAKEDGEILVKSDKVMKEYYKNPEATAQVFTEDGFFKTGDIGELDKQGFLKITDRKKDLIKTAGGKYVVPQKLVSHLKKDKLISQALIIGDKRRYIVALVTLNEEALKQYAEQNNISAENYEQLSQHKAIRKKVKEIIAEVNEPLASFETIKKFKVLPKDFTVEGGELTPSMKVKRRVIEDLYKEDVEKMYGN